METKQRPKESNPAAINPGYVYTKSQVMEIMHWKDRSWKTAKSKGLITHRHGCRDYILGKELIDFIVTLDASGNPIRSNH
ncbi:MAG: hypothetical protein R3C11_27075 [Planctomycetaceae bacterium]